MTLSINIIAKNEENYIEDCINSIIDISDEIIFLDTGSTDNTKKIALKYSKVKLFETEWDKNESKVRNKAVELSNYDWILSLDADERLTKDSQTYLLDFLEKSKNTQDTVFSLFYKNMFDFHSLSYFKSSLFKNDSRIKYFKSIHPYPYIEGIKTNFVICPEIVIEHIERSSDKDRRKENTDRYITELESLILESTEEDQAYYLKHLGDAYLTNKISDKALFAYIDSNNLYKKCKPININPIMYSANLIQIIEILVKKKEYIKAIGFSKELVLENSKTVKGYYYQALCYQYTKDFKIALENYKLALNNAVITNEPTEIISSLERNIYLLSKFV